jgi:uncharacterized membrane protein YqjE
MAHPIDPQQLRETRPLAADNDNRSLGELFSDLSRETSALVREEVALAKTELSQKAAQVGKDVGFLAAGGAVLYAGFLTIIAAIVLILIKAGMTPWLAALLVGIVVLAVGGFLVYRGINDLRTANLAPTATIESIKGDSR